MFIVKNNYKMMTQDSGDAYIIHHFILHSLSTPYSHICPSRKEKTTSVHDTLP